MKIFITGTTGFVGKNLVEYYYKEKIYEYKRSEDLISCLNTFKPDVIINSAAEIYDANKMWESNIILTGLCLEYVKENKVKMIQIGSSSEYGILDRASKETDRINPVDMYQATKGAATILCQGYSRHYDVDICVARPYSVYGKHEKLHRLFPNLWKAFVKNIPMKLYDGVHDFIFIDDFIRGIDILVNSDKTKSDIVNFGSGNQYTNKEVLDLFEKVANKKAPVEYIPEMTKKFESNIWKCDTTYSRDKYNFSCEYSLEKGIEKFLQTANYWG